MGRRQVHLRLCGTRPAGVSSVSGDVRVLVDDAAEVLPVPLVVAAG